MISARDRYDSLFAYYAWEYGVNPDWLKAQAIAESNLDPRAKSPVGARGLMQFMPATWREYWDKLYGSRGLPTGSPFNPEESIRAGARYMRDLLRAFDGDLDQALAAYNWGWGRVRRHVRKHGRLDHSLLPEETSRYIARIRRHHDTITV